MDGYQDGGSSRCLFARPPGWSGVGHRSSRIDGETPRFGLARTIAAALLVQVRQDRDTLRNVARRIGHSSSGLKDAAAWFAEKVSRLKLNHDSGDGLGTFEALEFLELGIFGKLVMWRALTELATVDPRLQGLDFEQLAARAELQRSKVEERRLDVGRAVFVPAT